jgi:hypothetical protein
LEPRVFKGTVTGQLGPVGIFVMLGGMVIWRLGLDDHLHLNAAGYLLTAFVVFCLVFAAPNVIAPPTLRIDDRGMTWKSWRRSATYLWSDIDKFLVGRAVRGGKPKIAFDFLPGKTPSQVNATALNRSVNGYDRSMANVWKMSTVELVDLLNSYLEHSRKMQATS